MRQLSSNIRLVNVPAIVASILLVALTACDEANDGTLDIKQWDDWLVPAHGGTMFPEPRSITIGQDDEIIVLDKRARVLVFDPQTGDCVRQWQMPDTEIGNPQNACVLMDGRIAVADTHYARIVFFDRQGNLAGMFGKAGDEPGDFFFPICIVQDDQGNLYVGEFGGKDRVQKFTLDGEFLMQIGELGDERGQFQRMAGMDWHRGSDGIGRLYIADAQNGRVQIFQDDGAFDGLLGDSTHTKTFNDEPYHHLDDPFDVDVDEAGNIYVTEWGGNRISKFAADGRLLGRFGAAGRDEGQFRTPWSAEVDSRGRIIVADTGNSRIVALKQ